VTKLAGEVGDQIAIGSVLVEIETEGTVVAPESRDEQPLGDGAVRATQAIASEIPTAATQGAVPSDAHTPLESKSDTPAYVRPEPLEGRSETLEPRPSTSSGRTDVEDQAKAKTLASPAVRQRARDLGIDLAQVKTSAERVRHADLDAYLLYNGGSVSHGAAAARPDETTKVVGLRRKIAENMQEAKRRIPHFTLVEEFDVTDLEDTRAMMNKDRGDNPKLTLLPFLITAMGKAIASWPMLNATFDDDAMQLTRHGAMHLGMATQTPGGLMVPVIRDAQGKDVWQLARDIARLADAAKSGKAAREELSGSTITLSSLGPMGGVTSTPVINRPEVAIIAVNKLREMPVIVDGEIEARKLMNLSLSCDHRVVDGWDAANFLQEMKRFIENPLRLLS
jgi:2-oxoisovalerate dehydrogenase E2 component (dihydrolipoyl transacylase)